MSVDESSGAQGLAPGPAALPPQPDAGAPPTRSSPLRIVLLVKTNNGAMWTLPQVAELRKRGHHLIAVLPRGPGRLTTALREQDVMVVESPWDMSFHPDLSTPFGLLRLRTLIRRLEPDVVNYHLYASALAGRLSTIGLPVRRVHMVAGPLYLESPIIRPIERLLWRLDHLTICGTGFTSEFYGQLGCPPSRRPVATCGVDTDRFSPAWSTGTPPGSPDDSSERELRAKARAEIGIPAGDFLVVMVAYVYPPKRLVHRGVGIKGHDVLLSAWRRFHASHPDSHLLLVGGGWTTEGEAHRQELIRRFGVNEDPSVTWLGSVPDVRTCYVAADISVSPSRSEGHGAAVEAGAMGVPSIVSDAGGLPETVDPASGWVVRRGDPEELAATLVAAYRSFRDDRLVERRRHVRQRIVDLFDSRRAAVDIADAIERIHFTNAPAGQ